ncbi:MAG TPA: hypothetical protein VK273_05190 [Gaiellaceae bacterium]|nr:hypothetical protein [Gaiellaceae bacterium]
MAVRVGLNMRFHEWVTESSRSVMLLACLASLPWETSTPKSVSREVGIGFGRPHPRGFIEAFNLDAL